VIEGDAAGATDVNYAGVALKTKLNPIRHYVFGDQTMALKSKSHGSIMIAF
jgi:hypothetical protein